MFLAIAFLKLAVYFILAAVVLGAIIGTILGVIKGVWRLYYPLPDRAIFISEDEDEEEVKPASRTQKAAVAAVSLGVGAYVGTKFGKSIV
jgi:hypothetical protein